MFGLGAQELVLVLAIILVLFGGKKLPELSKGLGETVKELRRAFTEDLDGQKKPKKEIKAKS